MASVGLHRACCCIIESKLFTPTKVSKEWVKLETSWRSPVIFIYLSLPGPWISYLEYCYIDRLLPVYVFLGSFVGPWQLLFLISWENIFKKKTFFFFLKKISERLWVRKVKTTVNTMFIENMWLEPDRRPFIKDLGHAGVWKGIPGSLSEQGRPGLPCCHTWPLLMRAAPQAFVLWEVTFSLFDKLRFLGC